MIEGLGYTIKYQDVETLGVVIFSMLFIWLEKLNPKEERMLIKDQLKYDVFAFVVLSIGVGLFRPLIAFCYDTMKLSSITTIESSKHWPIWIRILIVHILSDFCLYWVHRLMHTNEFFWRTHQWHHSVEKMYWFAGFRTSVMHIFIYAIPQVFLGFYLLKFNQIEIGIAFAIGVFSNMFIHANLTIPRWLPLELVFVTPDFHHPHHSQLGTQKKNFGNVFTLWDRLFGTYVDPRLIRKDYKYGLKEKPADWRMMIGI
jgi:sterol desaturase/sphingolipid hydroxylase (fatty acid hydroxylase superfamily)